MFVPLLYNLYQVQLSGLICFSFYFYYIFSQKNSKNLAGLFLSFTLFKIQLGIPFCLIALFIKDFKALKYCFLYTCFWSFLGFILIGFEGYIDYLKMILQLLNIINFNKFVAPLIKPIPPISDISAWLLNYNKNICAMNLIPYIKSISVLSKILSLGFMLYLNKIKNLDQKVALMSLTCLFLTQYHNSYDYIVLLISTLILTKSGFQNILIYFSIIACLIPNFLTASLGSQKLLDYHIHLYWLINLISLLGLYFYFESNIIKAKIVAKPAPII